MIDRTGGEGALHVTTRRQAVRETVGYGVELLEVVPSDSPRRLPSFAVESWYHAYLRA
jgi:hypothetical protein